MDKSIGNQIQNQTKPRRREASPFVRVNPGKQNPEITSAQNAWTQPFGW